DLIETSSKKSSKLCYNIARRSFDEASRTFGEPETVVDAAANGRSALFARVSPDGNFLAYTVATGGTFPIWRQEADLYLKDLRTGEERRWSELNSEDSDSYHTWSSSGRWIVFSSRREDGQYTRPYFAHVDENGVATKPFVLPQKDPQSNRRRYKSYNVPELIVEPIKIDLRTLYDAAAKDPEPTKNLPTIEP
ncbi:MAG: PD40 domain-containing protein, partial [Thermoguttaceae bacterium]|nr:PD40 domain-containing protein [Thermoguttaceae bacterium]